MGAPDGDTGYGISRIDAPAFRSHAWRVSLRRSGKLFVKNFPDRKHGGHAQALQQAIAYRDGILREYPPTSRVEFANAIRRNNRSGVVGVGLVTSRCRKADGTARSVQYWEAILPTQPGKNTKRRFSVSRYGFDLAFELAVKARQRHMQSVEGAFWPSARRNPAAPMASARVQLPGRPG